MNASSFALPLACICLAGMLTWAIAGISGRWLWKITLFVLTTGICLGIWSALPSFMGWPTREPMTGKVELVGVVVHEPSLRERYAGRIFVWVLPDAVSISSVLGYMPGSEEPRAHMLPYDRRTHAVLHTAMERIRNGERVLIGFPDPSDDAESRSRGDGMPYGIPEIYDLPPPALPRKLVR